jgi:hypothetical protein
MGAMHGASQARRLALPALAALLSALALAGLVGGCRVLPASGSRLPDGTPRPCWVAERRTIVLDGRLDDWRGVEFHQVTPQNGVFDLESAVTGDPADLSYRFAVCHDDQALYVAVEVTDDVLRVDDTTAGETHARAWCDDAVEIFLDGNHNRAPAARRPDGSEYACGGEFSLVANGAATSTCSGWPDSFDKPAFWQGATQIESRQGGGVIVRYEIRLAWAVMGGKVRPGDTIGFTLGVQDDDTGGERDHALYAVGISPHCWQNENGWADLLLAR